MKPLLLPYIFNILVLVPIAYKAAPSPSHNGSVNASISVRQLVAEAAWQSLRRSPTVRAYFERAQRGDPQRKKIALVATAHYLVRVMWAMLKRGTLWEEKMVKAR